MFTSQISHLEIMGNIKKVLREYLVDITLTDVHCLSFNFKDTQVPVYFWGLYQTVEAMAIKTYQEVELNNLESVDVYGIQATLLN